MLKLLDLSNTELREVLLSWGEPSYRADQLEHWIYKGFAGSFEEMTDLPRGLRDRLAQSASLGGPIPITEASSKDGLTYKALLKLDDGQTIETVLMLYSDAPGSPELEEPVGQPITRRTICISCQVGCPIGCPFCATGQAGYIRNLTPGEIVSQVLFMARRVGPPTNIVFMGMGEPLMKLDVTMQSVASLTDPKRLAMSARRITISTSGEIPGIIEFARVKSQVNLAVSLHAPNDVLRNRLVPLNRKYPIASLMDAVREYIDMTRRRVTFEYALMEGINDRPEKAEQLARLLDGMLCHVNLIPLNPTAGSPFGRTPYDRVKEFEQVLRRHGIPTTLRVEKGIEIAAGCGQLKQKSADTTTEAGLSNGQNRPVNSLGRPGAAR